LGRLDPPAGFFCWTNVKIKTPYDLAGLKIRSVPTYANFLEALGCARVSVPRVDIYSAMERGVIDGFFSNATLVKSLAQYEVSKYVISPKVYQSNIVVLMNLDAWKALPKELQDLISKAVADYEPESYAFYEKADNEALDWMVTSKGVKKIEFSPADAEWWVNLAYKTQLAELLKKCPESGAKLQKVMGW